MEELGHPDSAMLHYKQAEAIACPTDYAIMGQIHTRIADLYRRHYGDEQICYDKFNKAYHYHKLSGNQELQYNCLYNMFMMGGILKAAQ